MRQRQFQMIRIREQGFVEVGTGVDGTHPQLQPTPKTTAWTLQLTKDVTFCPPQLTNLSQVTTTVTPCGFPG